MICFYYPMGNSLSRVPDINHEDAKKFSHFPAKKIHEWSVSFREHFPRGYITVSELELIFKRLFPFGSPKNFSIRLFETINISQSNQVDFNEFLIAFSILLKGSDFEKLRWMFRFYDEDNDGIIDKKKMITIAQSIFDMTSNTLDVRIKADKVVDELFCTLDNKSGFLTFEDFKELSRKKPAAFKSLIMFMD
ncbi:Neuronal calcium sensor 1 [Nosema bombycis CQ1]|uniref:Neuronal calcium sensor 1 n=1 Tax=Nosema bombycis (strain CQ1 / CVCC 102059) TaxID=578461 RepID=R0M6H8_NOSB1|nr:Neuronal calcium sensor 1 [Nosema bombycis CQ1]|eukprot:EOB13609.1 Neuronal calcium sensor 1 [Nosema bombycis CQ1]